MWVPKPYPLIRFKVNRNMFLGGHLLDSLVNGGTFKAALALCGETGVEPLSGTSALHACPLASVPG